MKVKEIISANLVKKPLLKSIISKGIFRQFMKASDMNVIIVEISLVKK